LQKPSELPSLGKAWRRTAELNREKGCTEIQAPTAMANPQGWKLISVCHFLESGQDCWVSVWPPYASSSWKSLSVGKSTLQLMLYPEELRVEPVCWHHSTQQGQCTP
jgi:hypothetical protein